MAPGWTCSKARDPSTVPMSRPRWASTMRKVWPEAERTSTSPAGYPGPADVDAELQGARRDHPEQVPVEEAALDPPALLRQIARTVGTDPSGQGGRVFLERGAGVPVHELGDLARPREGDGPHLPAHELGEKRTRFGVRAAAPRARLIDERRGPGGG